MMDTVKETNQADKQKSDIMLQYLRPKKKFPSVWCAGCGNGVVMGAIIRAIDKLGYSRDEVVMVSGIGCSSRMPVYLDFSSLHTTHGRALPYATGVKFAKPHLKVIVITGDGDALAIGGNHFIHACRRNIDITAILINNYIYGMTGGQGSPTTPSQAFSTTTPFGNVEKHFEPAELAMAAGATFVGRTTVYHVPQMEKMIIQALEHKGFSLVEAVSNCHTYFGRLNRQGDPVAMLKMFKDLAVPAA
ncbi:MAG: 2-oxoacid:ferredoxin oxidoreductase subunit beta, partial [candidate division Zixibacteria bacterium]|nr:2-oxoacid:ferredoxin oxidoreductase subunit beta [candidate division Zixibacteria bacterium]